MAKKKLTDPVDEGDKTQNQQDDEQEMKDLFHPDSELPEDMLMEDEIGDVPVSAQTATHPFHGYPLGREIKIGGAKISTTFIVLLRDENAVVKDISGNKVDHAIFKKDDKGNDIKRTNIDGKFFNPEVEKVVKVDLGTYHNRVIQLGSLNSEENIDIVFDRSVMVGNRERICAIVPNHEVRSQICFLIDKKGRIRVDRRYQLADTNQVGRLRKTFDRVNYQHMKAERLASKFDSDPGRGEV